MEMNGIDQCRTVGVFPSYASKDDVPNKIIVFAGQHVQLILKLMSALSHNTGSSFNREFEVGGRSNVTSPCRPSMSSTPSCGCSWMSIR